MKITISKVMKVGRPSEGPPKEIDLHKHKIDVYISSVCVSVCLSVCEDSVRSMMCVCLSVCLCVKSASDL